MKMLKRINRNTRESFLTYALVVVLYVVMRALISGGNIKASLQGQLVPICAYIVMAISLNLTVGILGELSLGHAGFVSIGAFVGAIFCMSVEAAIPNAPVRLMLAMIIGAVCAGAAGVLIGIPVLRLRGDYLAIVTLAFGEIIKTIINVLYVGRDVNGLHFGFLSGIGALNLGEGAQTIVNGAVGITGIRKISTFTSGFVLILVALFIVQNLVRSRAGRAIMALRDNRIAAESVGIPITKYKLMAFVTSAALAGASGVLYAMSFTAIGAGKFDFNMSILILVFVVLGGLGKMWGSIIASTALIVLPELLRGFNDYRMLVYAIVLIFVMLITNNARVRHVLTQLGGRINKRPHTEDNTQGGAVK